MSILGEVPGVTPGASFADRAALAQAGVHRQHSRRKGTYRLIEDGEGVLSDKNADALLRKELGERGLEAEAIEHALAELDEEPRELAPGVRAARKTVSESEIKYRGDGELLADIVFALIAYRFVAVLAGSGIFVEELDGVRGWLRGETPQPPSCVVTRSWPKDRDYSARHGIRVKHERDGITTRVALFGVLWADVAFQCVRSSCVGAYSLDLATSEATWDLQPVSLG